jgi:glycosyltransferase involved in cell wall biosynthesis
MRVAYFGFPHVGGTFQVFRQLRCGLRPLGVTVQWIGLGEAAHQAIADPLWSAETAHGFVVGAPTGLPEVWARQLANALEAARFDAVFINVLTDAVQTNLARYLPPHLLRILIVHNITPGTYAAARAVRDHVHATIAISPRIRDDLKSKYGFSGERIVMIPHAIEANETSGRVDLPSDTRLRVLYLGRIEDEAKGVLSLPRILGRLPDDVTLTIAGDGKDLAELKRRCRAFGARVTFLGATDHAAAMELLSSHHALIMPSRYEGFGLTLIEAMAAGCVPVVSRIRGVTDWIVLDGREGLLFRVGSKAEAATCISALHDDRGRLRSMSKAARAAARSRYGLGAMASAYHALLERLRAEPPAIAQALDLADWDMPHGLRSSLRTHIPKPIKNLLRHVRERLA